MHLPRDYHTDMASGNLPPVTHMDWKTAATQAANATYKDLPESPSVENSQDNIPVFSNEEEQWRVVVVG